MIEVAFTSWTVATDSVAPEFGSTSLVNRLPAVSEVLLSVVKVSFTATGSWSPVIVIVTVAKFAETPPRESLME